MPIGHLGAVATKPGVCPPAPVVSDGRSGRLAITGSRHDRAPIDGSASVMNGADERVHPGLGESAKRFCGRAGGGGRTPRIRRAGRPGRRGGRGGGKRGSGRCLRCGGGSGSGGGARGWGGGRLVPSSSGAVPQREMCLWVDNRPVVLQSPHHRGGPSTELLQQANHPAASPSVPSSSGKSLNLRGIILALGLPFLQSPHHRGGPSTGGHLRVSYLRSSVPSSSGMSLNVLENTGAALGDRI
jgi:hypothetical protein